MKKLILFTLALIGTISAWGASYTSSDCAKYITSSTNIVEVLGAKGSTVTSTTKHMTMLVNLAAKDSIVIDGYRFENNSTNTTSGDSKNWSVIGAQGPSSGTAYGTLVLKNCTIVNPYMGAGVQSYTNAKVILENCYIEVSGYRGSASCAVQMQGGGRVHVISGTYISNAGASVLTCSSGGFVTIDGGTFTGANTAIPQGNMNFYGALFIYANEDGKSASATINGGTFNGYLYSACGKYNGETAELKIKGGSFTEDKVYDGPSKVTNTKITDSKWCDSNTEFVKEGDNYVAVKKLPLSDDKYVRSVPASGCGTICLPNNAAQPAGVTFYGIVGKDKAIDPTYIVLDTVKTDLEAGTPYIFTGTPSASMQFTLGTKPEYPTATAINGLIGTLAGVNWDATSSTALKADDESLDGMYLISGGEIKPANATGAYLAPNRAYIDLEEVPVVDAGAPGRRIYLNSNETTGCDAIFAESDQAQKVLLNGKLYIRRGANLFDAQGALVK